jgi:hypothetical protein
MKSITIHGLDSQLDKMIRKRAKREGKSLNKTIKELLEQSLGIRHGQNTDNREDFMDLFGKWNATEKKEFENTLKDFEKIDARDWS